MPIDVRATIRHLEQNDFGRIAYDVMGHVFEIHNEFGRQKFRLVAPSVAFKITALTDDPRLFESHARRLLEHTSLKVIQWINGAKDEVSFQTIRK
jgi:restriction endonuclease